jgi:hypothetical protein
MSWTPFKTTLVESSAITVTKPLNPEAGVTKVWVYVTQPGVNDGLQSPDAFGISPFVYEIQTDPGETEAPAGLGITMVGIPLLFVVAVLLPNVIVVGAESAGAGTHSATLPDIRIDQAIRQLVAAVPQNTPRYCREVGLFIFDLLRKVSARKHAVWH